MKTEKIIILGGIAAFLYFYFKSTTSVAAPYIAAVNTPGVITGIVTGAEAGGLGPFGGWFGALLPTNSGTTQ